MNKIKTLLLGTVASAVVVTGAQAADPIYDDIKAPREPVYRCDITGFIELPGTDICWKVGGFARAHYTFNSNSFAGAGARGIVPDFLVGNAAANYSGTAAGPRVGQHWGLQNQRYTFDGRFRVNFDARTQTEFGTLRAFAEQQYTSTGGLAHRHAYIQFGNWLFGQTNNAFFYGGSVAGYSDAYSTIGDGTFRTPQIRYTQPFGNGVSLSVALEDPGTVSGAVNAFTTGIGPNAPFNPLVATDRRSLPALTGNINVSGAWGGAQLGGVLLENRIGTAAVPGVVSPTSDSEFGWGVSFGMDLNVPTTEGSKLLFNATYTDGASAYQPSLFGGLNPSVSVVWGNTPGGTPASDRIVDSVEAWAVSGAYQHVFTPTVTGIIGGGYGQIDTGSAAVVPTGAAGTVPVLRAARADLWDLYGIVQWSPVSNLTFHLEGRYGHMDWNGRDTDPFSAGIQDTNDAFSVTFQATRSF